MKIPVLLYHSISDDNSPISLDKKNFENQLCYLKKNGFKSININKEPQENEKNIIITFDDGYKDNLLNALPLLKKYGFNAIIYIVTNLIGKENYWDINKDKFIKKELMTKSDIIEWQSSDMFIGSHSYNHTNMCNLTNKEIKNDLKTSKEQLENIIGKEVMSFSYPFGRINLNVYDNVKQIYSNAVTINRSRYNPTKHDRYLIPRIDMGKKLSKFKLFLKMMTFYEDIKYNKKLI